MIDTHAHLAYQDYEADSKAVLERAWQVGLEAIVLIGAGASWAGNQQTLEFAQQDPRLWVSLGFHPCDAEKVELADFALLEKHLRDPKVVAIGELGLDFHWPIDRKKQYDVLLPQLELAKKYQLPIIIHSRKAEAELWAELKKVGHPPQKGVFHCFAGDVNFAQEVIAEGYVLGIGGVLTFKNAKSLHEVVKAVPLEALILETDAPYLAPEPFRGKRNEPAYVDFVAQKIAELKNISVEEVRRVTTETARRLFHLKEVL